MVTAAQIGERFELGRAVSYARLGGLTQLGLLEHQRIFHAEPGVYLATRQGLHAVDLDLPPARVDLRTYRHDVELSSLVIELEREFGPDRVVTERQIRAVDTLGPREEKDYRPRFGVLLGRTSGSISVGGHPRVHYPDVAIEAGSGSSVLAVELERTRKGSSRVRSILRAYVAARHIDRVRYYTLHPQVHALVVDEVRRLRTDRIVEIRGRPPRTTAALDAAV